MFKKISGFKAALVFVLGLSLLSFATFANADDHRGENRRHGHFQHRHRDGMWYAEDEVIVPSVRVFIR